MLRHSEEISSRESAVYKRPLINGYLANHQRVTPQLKEPIDFLLDELKRPAGRISTVRTAVGVTQGVTLMKKKLSRYVQYIDAYFYFLRLCPWPIRTCIETM